jgi:hypothetical protein
MGMALVHAQVESEAFLGKFDGQISVRRVRKYAFLRLTVRGLSFSVKKGVWSLPNLPKRKAFLLWEMLFLST